MAEPIGIQDQRARAQQLMADAEARGYERALSEYGPLRVLRASLDEAHAHHITELRAFHVKHEQQLERHARQAHWAGIWKGATFASAAVSVVFILSVVWVNREFRLTDVTARTMESRGGALVLPAPNLTTRDPANYSDDRGLRRGLEPANAP